MIPSIITPAALGRQTFSENWAKPDLGPDQAAPGKHRWRTIMKGGFDAGSREITGESFGSDASLGIDPFLPRPQGMVMQCVKVPPEKQAALWGKKYAGSILTTKFSFSQVYGYFEVYGRLPDGKGAFPAFWMLPVTGAWPRNGEIDGFECTGDPRYIYCTVHSAALTAAEAKNAQKKVALGFDGSKGPHRYGVAWTKDEIVWFVDRKEVFRRPTPADMKAVPMYLILWLGCSHPWDNDRPDASTHWPLQMPIYSVGAWELAA